jgi:anti-sigma factor RsiW
MTESTARDCASILAEISGYLDGELESTECAAIEAHCLQCPRCASLVEGLRRTVGLCRDAGRVPLPDAVRERAHASVRRLLAEHERGGGA